MIYDVSLSWVSFFLALCGGAWAVLCWQPKEKVVGWLRAFPRHRWAGYLLMGTATVWVCTMVAVMDLGEFSSARQPIFLGLLALGAAALWLLDDFMAVRGLGAVLLLGANVALDAAFLIETPWKLVVVSLAYVMIVGGLVWVCSPYILRDMLEWLVARCSRLRWCGSVAGATALVLVVLGVWCF